MPKGVRQCKVCGAEYEYCKTENRGDRFRYQDVACSPEHGSIYLARVLESRNKADIKDDTHIINDFSDLLEDDEDDLFEEDFDDDDDDEAE